MSRLPPSFLVPLLSFLFTQSCVGGEENVTSRSCEELLLFSQHDMATGEWAATENAWMKRGHQRGCVLACRLHELAKVLFQTREAEGTESTRGCQVCTRPKKLYRS